MLINNVEGDDSANDFEEENTRDNFKEYQTANEFFKIMAQKHRNIVDENAFTTRDLVILYENMDVGMRAISSSTELVNKRPNQYVETIVYHDENDSEDSDVYEIYSNEDLHNVITTNNKRIDLLNNMPSFENSLCHKFGKIHIKSSDLSNEFNQHFLFNNTYVNEQLLSLHAMSDSEKYNSTFLSTFLLDYICYKRVDDNYNYYMENVIKHVQHTIEQLKRISNGDYLTDKAKEKWREVKNIFDIKNNDSVITPFLSAHPKALLPIQRKVNKPKSTWDDIVRSEIDVRSLRKLLEKKITLQVPKILFGSYRLCAKQFENKFIISCNKLKNQGKAEHENETSVKIIVNFTSSEPDHIINNRLDMITEHEIENKETIKILEIDDNKNEVSERKVMLYKDLPIKARSEKDFSSVSDEMYDSEANYGLLSSDEFDHNIQELNTQSTLLEQSEDFSINKKIPAKVRIKSPYENKSHIIEEKRRKRLLEIRERREKKKLAINDNSKINKHKYAKGAIMAQPSSSVTKLSITNKSFYNSIYGQTNTVKGFRNNYKYQKQNNIPDLKIQECEEEDCTNESYNYKQEQNVEKFVNRSYYLDDTDTEVKYNMEILPNTVDETVLCRDVHFLNPSITDLTCTDTTTTLDLNVLAGEFVRTENKENNCHDVISNISIKVPRNTPKQENGDLDKKNKASSSIECKKRIDDIYDLMRKKSISSTNLSCLSNSKAIQNNAKGEATNSLTLKSDSGINVKHQLISSDLANTGFKKTLPVHTSSKKAVNTKIDSVTITEPKVVINSKNQAYKTVKDSARKESKKVEFKNTNNPLKAISQLIHDIDNIQKTRHKSGSEPKKRRRNNSEETNILQQSSIKTALRQEKNIKQSSIDTSRTTKPLLTPVINKSPKEEKPVIKKLADIIDEVKEMRGEAVRGPPKLSSRIDNLAQPKKTYVRAQQQEYQSRLNRYATLKGQKTSTYSNSFQERNLRSKYTNRQREDANIPIVTVNKRSNKTEHSSEKQQNFKRRADIGTPEREMNLQSSQATQKRSKSFISSEAENPFEKKMTAVKTFLNDRYGQVLSKAIPDLKDLAENSRVPLIPTDFDLASVASSPAPEESTTLGNKLHDMINSKIANNTSQIIDFIENKEESTSQPDENRLMSFELPPECDTDTITSTSDYPIDIFKDRNIVTAVACTSLENNSVICKTKTQGLSLDNELQLLENALYRQISMGNFQKRLRMKKFTLTPKHSLQQISVLQSGDDNTITIKTALSQKLVFSKADSLLKPNILPVISNDAINWKLPMKMTTVGYMFPSYKVLNFKTKNEACNNKHFTTGLLTTKYSKTVQCYMGGNEQSVFNKNSNINNNSANVSSACLPKNELHNVSVKVTTSEKHLTCNKSEQKIKKQRSPDISTSTSLDILVNLLDEIKKITTCQSTFISPAHEENACDESKHINLKKATAGHFIDHKKSLSMTELDKLRQVHFSNIPNVDDANVKFKSKKEGRISSDLNYLRTVFSEKSVEAVISTKEFVHGFTDVPSRFISCTVNRSASAISSILAVVKKSSHELKSHCTSLTLKSKPLINEIKTLLPFITKSKVVSSLKLENTNLQVTDELASNTITVIYENTKHKMSKHLNSYNVTDKRTEIDSTLKMKRDILVTVYSILVFTVFAALTFPEILTQT